MAAVEKKTAEINLQQSICTESPDGTDIFAFGDKAATHQQNTGMERNGGLTNIYEQETTFATAGLQSIITKSGDVLQVDANHDVRINDIAIGNVGPFAVSLRGVLRGYSDAAWTVGNTIIGIVKIGQKIKVDEINPVTGAVINTRSTTFTIPAQVYTNVILVKYLAMNFADSLTFIISASSGGYILVEANAPTAVATGGGVTSVNMCWQFAAAKYIFGNQGVRFWIGDIAGVFSAITDATWCVIDTFTGTAFSRAILTFPVKKNAANDVTGIADVGYNQAGVYSATPTQYGTAIGAATITVGTHAEGPGYSEATFTRSDTGTNIYYYISPDYRTGGAAISEVQQSQTHTQYNGYGRLNRFGGNTLGKTCNLRILMQAGIPTTISAAVKNSNAFDTLGVPITNVGEFDETYMPHVDDDGSTRVNCIYRYNGVLFFFTIQSGVTNTLQAVSDNVYMVNCLSPINAIDVANKSLNLGSNDYNGRILFVSTAAIIATVKCVGIMQGPYANSIDSGDKLITQTFSVATNQVPGIEMPSFVDRSVFGFGADIFISDLYSITYQSITGTLVNSSRTDVLYVADTRIPFAMGYTFYSRVMQTEIETIFSGVGVTGSADIDHDYLNYELGNDTPGQYRSFVLFGQTYLFDGQNIWQATFDGSLFNGKGNDPIAPAAGLQLIATSPLAAFFLSPFDNSIYSFTGGRALEKFHRMNQEETITGGVYSTRDETLLLTTANTFLWVRDKIITRNAKKATQTALGIFDTEDGIAICNTTTKWIYSYTLLAGSTVVTLTWQGPYYGLKENLRHTIRNYVYVLYSSTRISASISLSHNSYDQETSVTDADVQQIKPSDWSNLGFYVGRYSPKVLRALASSVGISTAAKVVLNRVTVEYEEGVQAIVAKERDK